MNKRPVCAIILSDKSSGSSIVQDELSKHKDVNTIAKTPHAQNETLYWLKSSVVLGLPQKKMVYSGYSQTNETARDALTKLLGDNVALYQEAKNDEELVYGGWKLLCEQYKPVFLEKSPHHLLSPSALKLLFEAPDHIPEVDFRYIGLVRNPMDTIYSYWGRWHVDPAEKEQEWFSAYAKLLELKDKYENRVLIIKYEDLVKDRNQFRNICSFIGVEWMEEIGKGVHARSVSKWRTDKLFGFNLSKETTDLAVLYGYNQEELSNYNKSGLLWKCNRLINRRTHTYNINKRKIKRTIRKFLKKDGDVSIVDSN